MLEREEGDRWAVFPLAGSEVFPKISNEFPFPIWAVWPDGGIKSSPNFPKAALKVSTVVFLLKSDLLKKPKKLINIRAT